MAISASDYEVAAREINEARNAFAQKVWPFVSNDWSMRNIFKLTDEEISRRYPLDDFVQQVYRGA
jgi:hypothetical protein